MQYTQFGNMGGGICLGNCCTGVGNFVSYCIRKFTMEQPEEEFEKDGLSDADRIKIENAMLDLAYENSYAVLTHEISFEDLLAEKAKFGVSAILSFDPMDGPRKKDIEDIISYYVGLDEPEYYLRCAELKKILDREEFIV